MDIKVYPTTFEAYDEDMQVFKVEVFDENYAKVTINDLMNVNIWDEVSPLIRQCLVDMKLSDDSIE